MKRWFKLFGALSLLLALTGCGDDDTIVDPDKFTEFQSTNVKQGAVYFSFDAMAEVMTPDVSFKLVNRSPEFYLNRAVLGNGQLNGPVLIHNTQSTSMGAVTAVPISETMFTADADTIITGDAWYNYDFANHVIVSKNLVYIVKTARDNYVKFKIDGYAGGIFSISYSTYTDSVFAATQTDTIRVVANPATDLNGEALYSFKHSKLTAKAWDIKLTYGPVNEPGAPVGVKFPMILLNRNANVKAKILAATEKFDDVDPQTVTGLASDTNAAYVIGMRCLQYDETTHRLNPTEETIVVETSGGKRAKLKMTNYYNEAGSSGYMKFQYVVTD